MISIRKTIKYLNLGRKKILHEIDINRFLKTGNRPPRPLKLYYLMTNKCNFACRMCPQWKAGQKEDPNAYISEDRMKEIIDEMKNSGMAEIGFSGGEPLLYKDKLLNLLTYANEKGLYTHFATNGKLVTREFLDAYNRVGGGHISLSVDALGGKHDELRGFSGAYEAALEVINIIKRNDFGNLNLKINLTLSQGNLEEALRVARMATENNVLIFIQPYDSYDYGNKNIENKQQKDPLWIQKESQDKLRQVINELMEVKNKYPGLVLNSRGHLENFYPYFTDPQFSIECAAPLDSLSIDPFGNIIFCKFGIIGNIKNNSLKAFLESDTRKRIVGAALSCREGCLLGCMFRPGVSEMLKGGAGHLAKLIRR
ncbi:MAG: radical SAM/SPASM domain-containing protein [Patescibacteria group bacterium]